ncbi:MAG: hypothetical protein H6878_12740 [Rhodobiaceae bacterium]|nr:hypothetical protein [Rhodobiaceae bacterium]
MSIYESKLEALVDGSLRPDDFSHLDHVGIACEALSQHDFYEALAIVGKGIRAMAAGAGTLEKYNETITFAYMSLIAERMRTKGYADAASFIAENADLVDRRLLSSWYSPERLASETARAIPLMPDRGRTALSASRSGGIT